MLLWLSSAALVNRFDPPPSLECNGIWFEDCNGLLVDLRVAEKSLPGAKSIVEHLLGEPGQHAGPLPQDQPTAWQTLATMFET